MREVIRKWRPFEYRKEKINFHEKPRGIFSGLTSDQIERFLVRNKINFSRNSPHTVLMKKNPEVERHSGLEGSSGDAGLEQNLKQNENCVLERNPGVRMNLGVEVKNGVENSGDVEEISTEQRRIRKENLNAVEKNYGEEDEAGVSMETW